MEALGGQSAGQSDQSAKHTLKIHGSSGPGPLQRTGTALGAPHVTATDRATTAGEDYISAQAQRIQRIQLQGGHMHSAWLAD